MYDVRPGRHFFGYRLQIIADRPLGYDPPICWIPRRQDNSSGGQVWVPGDQWGPFSQHLINLSFGQCRMLPILQERVDGVLQGAALDWPLDFESGGSPPRFATRWAIVRQRDERLGLLGCAGRLPAACSLYRKPLLVPTAMLTYANGLAFTFSQDLDPAAQDPQAYRVQRRDYQYGRRTGSPEYSDMKRSVVGRVEHDVLSATILADRRTLFLEIHGFRPAMQYAITGELRANGLNGTLRAYPTIHHVPVRRLPDVVLVRKHGPGSVSIRRCASACSRDCWLRDCSREVDAGCVDADGGVVAQPRFSDIGVRRLDRTPRGDHYRFRVEGTGVSQVLIDGNPVWTANSGVGARPR